MALREHSAWLKAQTLLSLLKQRGLGLFLSYSTDVHGLCVCLGMPPASQRSDPILRAHS